MASIHPFKLRWGIISTGTIATVFVKDLLVDPKTRNVEDVAHTVVAVGSRSVKTAQEFIDTVAGGDKSIKAYGTYEGVYADKDVDAIYIGTPHTLHYDNALDAIRAKKHVLCEKPVTTNATELKSLIAAAKENDVFFMEAMWTRFQPLTLRIKEIIDSGELGSPLMLHADLSYDSEIHTKPKTHRMLDPTLGGGALLDLGPYPLFWAIIALFEHQKNNFSKPDSIKASMLKTPITDVDSSTVFTLAFSSLNAQAILSCSMITHTSSSGVIIRFEKGVISINTPIFCPTEFTVTRLDKDGSLTREEKQVIKFVGGGWHFQADDVARCVRDGKRESMLWGHNKSLLEMEIFDEVRRQGGYVFPPGVEKVV